jgi:hypothetical protein
MRPQHSFPPQDVAIKHKLGGTDRAVKPDNKIANDLIVDFESFQNCEN